MGNFCSKKVTFKEGELVDDIYNKIQPLDLIFFSGSEVFSKGIRKLSKLREGSGKYSHVGIVINRDLINDPRMSPNELYIWEATGSGLLNRKVKNLDNKAFLGVQARKLRPLLETYDDKPNSKIAWGPLTRNKRDQIESNYSRVCSTMRRLFDEYNGRVYDCNCCSLCSVVFEPLRHFRPIYEFITDEWIFCSELCAIVYRELDLIDYRIEPNTVAPINFLGYDQDDPKIVDLVREDIPMTIAKYHRTINPSRSRVNVNSVSYSYTTNSELSSNYQEVTLSDDNDYTTI